jgi:hypothetical protein
MLSFIDKNGRSLLSATLITIYATTTMQKLAAQESRVLLHKAKVHFGRGFEPGLNLRKVGTLVGT